MPPLPRYLRNLLLVALIAALITVAIWFLTRTKPVGVMLASVDRGLVERVVTNTRAATVTACRRAKLAPLTGGQIVKLHVSKGERVKAGQVLLELWNENLDAQQRAAQDQLEGARLHAQEACLSADLARRDADRARQLKDQGFISMERVDRAVSEAETRAVGCRAAQADVEQSQAKLAAVRAELSRTYLRAPFAGVVAEVTGELGEVAIPSPPGIPTPPAVDLIDDSCLYVTAPIDEVDAPAVKLRMPARISVDAFPGQRFKGYVRRIAPYVLDVEKQARTVDVEVEFSDPHETQSLLVGYSADVEIVLDKHEDVLRVPTSAIREGNRVLVYDQNKKVAEERSITTGLANWQYTEVTAGLQAGDRVIVSLERSGVKPGAKVRPETAASTKQ